MANVAGATGVFVVGFRVVVFASIHSTGHRREKRGWWWGVLYHFWVVH